MKKENIEDIKEVIKNNSEDFFSLLGDLQEKGFKTTITEIEEKHFYIVKRHGETIMIGNKNNVSLRNEDVVVEDIAFGKVE